MQQIERKLIEAAIVEAAKVGFHAYQVNDGGDNVPAQTVAEVVEVLTDSITHASIHFKHEDGRRAWLFVVMGNGEDCLADHSVTPDFSEAMDRACFAE